MAGPADFDARDRAHLSINAFRESANYSFPSRNQTRKPLRQDYAAHADSLLGQLVAALGEVPLAGADLRLTVQGLKAGTIVKISTAQPPAQSRTKAVKVPSALEFPAQEIVFLRSERRDDRSESAILFVPDDARTFLQGRITEYGRDPGNQRRPDVERFEVVETFEAVDVRALFTGRVDFDAPEEPVARLPAYG